MQKWIDFKNKRYKCSRILQDLKKKFQDSQKYSQKGLLVTLFLVVAKVPTIGCEIKVSPGAGLPYSGAPD